MQGELQSGEHHPAGQRHQGPRRCQRPYTFLTTMATGNTPPIPPTPPRPSGSMHRSRGLPPVQFSLTTPPPLPIQPANLTLPEPPQINRGVQAPITQQAQMPVNPSPVFPSQTSAFLPDQSGFSSFRDQHPYFRDTSFPSQINPLPQNPQVTTPSRASILGADMWKK